MRNFNAPPVATSVLAVSGSIPMESIQRDFLTQRVGQICDKHDKVLRKQFFMDAQDRPLSARDLIKAITDGNFTLDEALLAKHDEEELRSYYNNEYGIRWGKEKPNREGYNTARAVLLEAGQEVIDAMW